jgi:hypothetical protein
MIRGKNNLNYEYYNRYLVNCGSNNLTEIDLINDFFKERLQNLPEHELDPPSMILLNELVTFCRNKFDSSNEENTN